MKTIKVRELTPDDLGRSVVVLTLEETVSAQLHSYEVAEVSPSNMGFVNRPSLTLSVREGFGKRTWKNLPLDTTIQIDRGVA